MGALPSGLTPVAAATDPSGRYLYVLNFSDGTIPGSISEYSIGGAGALTNVGTASAGSAPYAIAVDPTGRYVYVTDLSDYNVRSYNIGAGGALVPIGVPATTGTSPSAIAVDPSGRFVYVADEWSNQVSQYSVGTGGGLTPIGSGLVNAGQTPKGQNPVAIAIHPNGRYAYVANYGDASLSEFAIGADGSLSQYGSVPTGLAPSSISVDPSGRYLYVTNSSDSTVSQYSIDTAGGLTPIGGPVTTGNTPVTIGSGY
jgi:6-phosphogluconolactonase (cycloisomerase 2 family)